jgi:hypothetical protein
MTRALRRLVPVVLGVLAGSAGSACGADVAPQVAPPMALRTPQALTECATPPADLQARLWISGYADPCFLDVVGDVTSGDCPVAPGITRRFTLDWFIDAGGRTVVLAQATRELDLTGATEASTVLAFTDGDVKTSPCLDMSEDSFAGRDTVLLDGAARPVCDLDVDGIANLDEVCGGQDPFGGL